MTDAFSSNSEVVIQRRVDVSSIRADLSHESWEELYEIQKTCHFINSNQFKKVRQHDIAHR